MTFRQLSLLFVTSTLIVTFAACGSDHHTGPLAIAFSSTPPATMTAGTNVSLTATVTNDSKNAGVDWTISCTGQCGTLSSAHTASGAGVTYTAPVTIPSGGVTVKAASTTDPTKNVSASITISGNAILADGTYVFQLAGQDSLGVYPTSQATFNAAGAFTVSGGNITAGEEDYNDLNVVANIAISGGSITGTADGNVQIVLDTGSGSPIGVGGLQTLNATLTTPNSGLISEFDTFAAGNGNIWPQTTASQTAPSGGYAFVTTGYDLTGCPLAFGGVVNVDGAGSISGAGSVYDLSDCGGQVQGDTLDASTVLGPTSPTPDPLGRVAFTINPNVNNGVGQFVLIGYIIDASRIALVESADTFGAISGGLAFSQGTHTGAFSASNISNSSYVLSAQGADPSFFTQFASASTFNSDGSVTGGATYNDGSSLLDGTTAAPAASYTVDPTGRVTLTGLILTDTATSNTITTNQQFYLDGSGNALALTYDGFNTLSGPAYQASTATLSGSYALGAIGSTATEELSAVGPVGIGAAGATTGFTDINDFGVALSPQVALTANVVNGIGDISGLDVITPANNNVFTFYVIDSNRWVGIESDTNQLTLLNSELQH
jgi:hypothetical protein